MGQTCTEVQLHINHMFSNTEAGDLEVFQNMAGRKKKLVSRDGKDVKVGSRENTVLGIQQRNTNKGSEWNGIYQNKIVMRVKISGVHFRMFSSFSCTNNGQESFGQRLNSCIIFERGILPHCRRLRLHDFIQTANTSIEINTICMHRI